MPAHAVPIDIKEQGVTWLLPPYNWSIRHLPSPSLNSCRWAVASEKRHLHIMVNRLDYFGSIKTCAVIVCPPADSTTPLNVSVERSSVL